MDDREDQLASRCKGACGRVLPLVGLAGFLIASATVGYAQGVGNAMRAASPCDLDCVAADIVATAGRLDDGDLFEPMEVAASMLVDIATVLAQNGRVDRAAGMVDRLAEVPLAERAKNRQRVLANLAQAEAYAAAGNVGEADRLFAQAASLIDALDGSPSWLRARLARALWRTQRTAAASQALELIDRAQYRAPVLADMAVTLAQSGDVNAARRMFRGAFRAVAEVANHAIGTHGRIRAFSAVAAGLVALGEVDEALALAATVESDFERVGTMAAIAVAQHEAGTPAAAQKTLSEALAIARGIADSHTRAWALRAIVAGGELYNHALPSDPPQANRSVVGPAVAFQLKALAAAIDPPERGWALTTAVHALARAGEIAVAFATAAEIDSDCDAARALAAIAAAQATAGKIDEAIATAHRIGTPLPNAQRDCGYLDAALETVATAQAESGRVDAAFATLAEVGSDDERLGTLAAIGKALANAPVD